MANVYAHKNRKGFTKAIYVKGERTHNAQTQTAPLPHLCFNLNMLPWLDQTAIKKAIQDYRTPYGVVFKLCRDISLPKQFCSPLDPLILNNEFRQFQNQQSAKNTIDLIQSQNSVNEMNTRPGQENSHTQRNTLNASSTKFTPNPLSEEFIPSRGATQSQTSTGGPVIARGSNILPQSQVPKPKGPLPRNPTDKSKTRK